MHIGSVLQERPRSTESQRPLDEAEEERLIRVSGGAAMRGCRLPVAGEWGDTAPNLQRWRQRASCLDQPGKVPSMVAGPSARSG